MRKVIVVARSILPWNHAPVFAAPTLPLMNRFLTCNNTTLNIERCLSVARRPVHTIPQAITTAASGLEPRRSTHMPVFTQSVNSSNELNATRRLSVTQSYPDPASKKNLQLYTNPCGPSQVSRVSWPVLSFRANDLSMDPSAQRLFSRGSDCKRKAGEEDEQQVGRVGGEALPLSSAL